MSAEAVEKIVWILIYGGLLTLALGLSLALSAASAEPALGWSLVSAGGIAALAGAVLIYVRSRMKG